MQRDPEYAAMARERDKLRMRERRTPETRLRDRDYMRARRAAHPEILERDRIRINEQRQKDIVKFLIRSAKSRSVKFGLPFDLTLDWARERWTGRCELTDIPFEWRRGILGLFSPSIDKIDRSKGYVQGNCRFILMAVNSLKGVGTDDDMFRIAAALAARRASSPI